LPIENLADLLLANAKGVCDALLCPPVCAKLSDAQNLRLSKLGTVCTFAACHAFWVQA